MKTGMVKDGSILRMRVQIFGRMIGGDVFTYVCTLRHAEWGFFSVSPIV
jgi:hypothetical protein